MPITWNADHSVVYHLEENPAGVAPQAKHSADAGRVELRGCRPVRTRRADARAERIPGSPGYVHRESWKMMPSVWRWPERSRLTPWRRLTR
jgi:hypothetical protein